MGDKPGGASRPPYLPPDPEDDYGGAGYPRPSLRHRLTDGLILIGATLLIGVIAIVGSYYVGRWLDERDAQYANISTLAVGACFDYAAPPPDENLLPDIRPADCAAAHDAELIGRFAWPSDDGGPDEPAAPYPGLLALSERGDFVCNDLFRAYAGTASGAADLAVVPTLPTRSAWRHIEERVINCFVERWDGTKLTGSVRDSGR